MSELITVPTFTFQQGDPFSGEGSPEYPIQVLYYHTCISLEQNGNSININYEYFEKLFREIRKHLPEATSKLKW